MVAYRNKTPYGNAPAVGGPSGAAMGFYNKQTQQHYASPQEAYAASQGAGAGGSAAPQGPAAPPVSQQQMIGAYTKQTGKPYYGPGSFVGVGGTSSLQDWYSKFGQGATRGGVGGVGAAAGGAPQGPAGMTGGGGPGYATGVPTTVDEAHARALGNTRTDRDLYNSPQAQALMGNIHSTAVGGPSPMLNQLSQMTLAGKAQAADANARAQQLQQQQMARYGGRAGVNTGAAQIQARSDAARRLMSEYTQRDIGHSAQAMRIMGAAQDQYMGALRDMGMHHRGVSGMENQILSQMHEVEDDAFSGWQGALSGGSVTGDPTMAGPGTFQMSGGRATGGVHGGWQTKDLTPAWKKKQQAAEKDKADQEQFYKDQMNMSPEAFARKYPLQHQFDVARARGGYRDPVLSFDDEEEDA